MTAPSFIYLAIIVCKIGYFCPLKSFLRDLADDFTKNAEVKFGCKPWNFLLYLFKFGRFLRDVLHRGKEVVLGDFKVLFWAIKVIFQQLILLLYKQVFPRENFTHHLIDKGEILIQRILTFYVDFLYFIQKKIRKNLFDHWNLVAEYFSYLSHHSLENFNRVDVPEIAFIFILNDKIKGLNIVQNGWKNGTWHYWLFEFVPIWFFKFYVRFYFLNVHCVNNLIQ